METTTAKTKTRFGRRETKSEAARRLQELIVLN
jgi:hypothetical protein